MKVRLLPSFILWASLLFYLEPPVLGPFLLAAAVHEAGHLLCLRRMGIPVRELRLGLLGAEIETGPLSYRQELLAALAGPGASLLLSAILPLWPALGLYSLILGLFNLLPMPGLDGGRALRSLLMMTLPPDRGERIARLAALVTALGLWGGAIYLSGPGGLGLWPLLLAAVFLGKALALCLA